MTRLTALSNSLTLLWEAHQSITQDPSGDLLLVELGRDIAELARKVESYRHAEHTRNNGGA